MARRSRPEIGASARALVAVAIAAAALAAPAHAQDEEGSGLPLDFGDPLALEQEPVPEIDQPDASLEPVFDSYTGGGLTPSGSRPESVAVGTAPDGTGRLYVATAQGDAIVEFDSDTLARVGSFGDTLGPGDLEEPAGIAYYRGEVYVLDQTDATTYSRVVIYGPDGDYRRQVRLPLALEVSGLDVAWNQLWVTFQGCGGFAGGVLVVDAETGAIEHVVVHPSHEPAGDQEAPCDERTDPAGWWDIAIAPELNVAIAGNRMIDRGRIPGTASSDPELACLRCPVRRYADGGDAIWGMRWFITVDGDTSTSRGTGISEYSLEPNPTTGHPQLVQRRRWTPKQAHTNTVRDVAYQSREAHLVWDGALTGDEWLRGSQCVDYVASDADIFVAGDRIEHWLEQASDFERAEFFVDGVLQETKFAPAGRFCAATSAFASGTHTIEVAAKVGERWIRMANDGARFDNTLPEGAVDLPPPISTGPVEIAGTAADDHSGPSDWQLEVRKENQSWTKACDPAAAPYDCSWATGTKQSGQAVYPDGRYLMRAQVRDSVKPDFGGPNVKQTDPPVRTIVDNNPPTLTAAGAARPGPDAGPLADGRYGLTVSASDGEGSGVRKVQFLVDGTEVSALNGTSCPDGGCDLAGAFKLRTDSFDAGPHTLQVVATDGAGFTSTEQWDVTTRNAPTLSVSGLLWSQTAVFEDGRYGVHVDADDGDSGVKSIELLVSGQRRAYAEQPCADEPGACQMSRDFVFRTDDQDAGVHAVRVLVTDQAGNTADTSWQIEIRNKPTFTLAGALRDTAGILADGRYGLQVAARDGDSGMKSIELLVDGERRDYAAQDCADPPGACDFDKNLTFRTDDQAEGGHEVRVVVRDQRGHSSDASWPIDIRNRPTVGVSGPVRTPDGILDGRYALNTTSTDADSGVGSVEVTVDGVRQSIGTVGCSQGFCTYGHDTTLNTDDYTEGTHTVMVTALDRQGHSASESWTINTLNRPRMSLAGALWDRRDGQNIYDDERPSLHVAATDAGGGVRSVEVVVAGLRRSFAEQGCAGGGCSMGHDYTLNPAELPEGVHQVRVIVTDQAGHTAESSWNVVVMRSRPDTPDESQTDSLDQPDSVNPDQEDVPAPDDQADDSDMAGPDGMHPDLECDESDPFIVTDHMDVSHDPVLALLGRVGHPTPEAAVMGFLNASVLLPKMAPSAFSKEVAAGPHAFFSAIADGERRAVVTAVMNSSGRWEATDFAGCAGYLDEQLALQGVAG